MKKQIVQLTLTVSLFLVLAGCSARIDPHDTTSVRGNWTPIQAELGGKPMPEAVLKTISLKLDEGTYVAIVGAQPDRGTYAIDAATSPKSMVITGTEGPNKGKIFPAIYELSGETLRICYDLSGADRPKEFKTATGTQLFLATYRRTP